MSCNLSEKQEILLCRLFDGDLGMIDRLRANLLVKKRCEARDFLHNLRSISTAVSVQSGSTSAAESSPQPVCDLWDKIAQRISAEERASIFLGSRVRQSTLSDNSLKQTWYNFFSTQALLGGLSGAATTALVLLVVNGMKSPNSSSGEMVSASSGNSPQLVSQATLAGNGFEQSRTSVGAPYSAASTSSRPLLLQDRAHSVMEVDWMRGDGPLRVIQNPSERSTIIWVKRQNQERNVSARGRQSIQAIQRGKLPELMVTNTPGFGGSSLGSSNR